MNYMSHLLDDQQMRELVLETGFGLESIDFSISENLDHMEQTLEVYQKRLQQISTGCFGSEAEVCKENVSECSLTLHGPFLDLNAMAFDSLVQQATMTRYEQTYEAARRLGAKKIVFHAGYVPSVYYLEGWAERMADFYNRFLENKTDEIQILMENVLDPYPEPLLEVAKGVHHPVFGICLDIGHAHCYSEIPLNQWIKVLEPYICHLHIHDNMGDRDSHLALGDGTIPKEEVLRLVKNGTEYTIECMKKEDVANTAGRIKQWLDY